MRTGTLSVGVVLINWNAGEFTIPCIRSLLAGTERPDVIVVVDNASSDGSAEAINSEYPQVILVRNETNRGFAGANNQGIELLLRAGAAYIWLLNNDTVVATDCLEKLSMVVNRHLVGVGFSAKVFYDTPRYFPWYAGVIVIVGTWASSTIWIRSWILILLVGSCQCPLFLAVVCLYLHGLGENMVA